MTAWLFKYWRLLRSPLTPVYKLLVQPVVVLMLPLATRLPLPPHNWTLLNLVLKVAAGLRVIAGNFDIYLILLLWGGMIADSIDGAVARHNSTSSFFGAYLDRIVDRAAASFILSGLFIYLSSRLDNLYVLSLGFSVILVDIWHETLRSWVSLTGGLLEERDPLPGWEKKLRRCGLIPIYGHDTLFLLLGVGGLFLSPETVARSIMLLCTISFLYQYWVHRRGARQCGKWGEKYRWQLQKRLLWRALGLVVLTGSGWWLLQNFNLSIAWLWGIIWFEFYLFYIPANYLMSLSADIPEQPAERNKYLEQMQVEDHRFLFRLYP